MMVQQVAKIRNLGKFAGCEFCNLQNLYIYKDKIVYSAPKTKNSMLLQCKLRNFAATVHRAKFSVLTSAQKINQKPKKINTRKILKNAKKMKINLKTKIN